MTLQDRMTNLKPYFRGIEMYNEAIMVKVSYPTNWKSYPSSDGRIKVAPGENEPNITFYYADSNDTTYEDIFDLVEETVKENKDVVLKLKLLKEKVEELKVLFSKMTYEELSTLSFTTSKPKKSKQKKSSQKKNKEETAVKEENIVDENNEEKTLKE